jgi:hypothetical protein
MFPDQNQPMMRALLAPARALEPSEAEVASVLARVGRANARPSAAESRPGGSARRTSRRAAARPRPAVAAWRRPLVAGLAAFLLVAAGLWSVPATRAALEDAGSGVGGTFSGWLGGESADAPGRPLRADETAAEPTPTYLYDPKAAKEPRVIAEADGYKLYSYLSPGGGISFLLGAGFGMGFPNTSYLGKAPLHVLGPGTKRHVDAEGHIPLYGIAAKTVTSIELTYSSGPPLRLDNVEGGFVLLAEPAHEPEEVIALDSAGGVVGRESVSQDEWERYLLPKSDEPPPPGAGQGG